VGIITVLAAIAWVRRWVAPTQNPQSIQFLQKFRWLGRGDLRKEIKE
jgi:hypothetical protein